MADKRVFDKLEELIYAGHRIIDEIVFIEQMAKTYYEEAEDEISKKLFLDLNNALADSGHLIARSNIRVADEIIKITSKIIADDTNEENTEAPG